MKTRSSITLTKQDQIILNSYHSVLNGLADFLGEGFEFVLHSLENYDESILQIVNGFHTGRKLKGPITDIALEVFRKLKNEKLNSYISYDTKNKKGLPIRSSTIIIHGEDHRPIALLCINFYMDTPISKMFPYFETAQTKSETANQIIHNIDDVIMQSFYNARRKVLANDTVLASLKTKEIIHILYDQGIFHIKDSVGKIAELLEISKNTVYMHLRSIEKNKKS